jgi:hypothetical protein
MACVGSPRAGTARQLADALGLAGEDRSALLAAGRCIEVTAESTPSPPFSDRPVPLTSFIGREQELRGELLHLSPRTVDNHLARIYARLGLSGRLQLTTWYLQHETPELSGRGSASGWPGPH